MIYFDYNATTKVSPQVLAKMNEAYQLPLNGSAVHQLGRQAAQMVETARKELKNLLNAKNYEVIFTGTSTEATNMLMFGTTANKILFSAIEHAAVYECRPSDKKIIEFDVLENGLVDIADVEKKLAELTDANFLVSVMLANNETGAIQPVAEIAKLVHQKGGLFHCDIVQALGKVETDLEQLNVDFASVSAHKINGPQGVGALLVRKGLDLKPLIYGGKQEKSKRAGTINVAGIAGFGEACKHAKEKILSYANVEKMRNFLESEIKKIGGTDVKIFADTVARLPNTSYIALKNADSQTQLINFDLNGICVSSGPACSSGAATASRALKAMKVTPDFSASAIRVSLSNENTPEEIKKFIQVWSDFYQKTKF
jgi:cysteine desulfurase